MDKKRTSSGLVIGVILVVIGAISMSSLVFPGLDMDSLWPLIVIGIGVAFLLAAYLAGPDYTRMAIPGSILTMVGLILFVLNLTGRWEAWAYCWALILGAVGAGQYLQGTLADQPELRKRGLDAMRGGLILFLIFGVVLEFIFSATGVGHSESLLLWALLLFAVGIFLLITRILRIGRNAAGDNDLFWPVIMLAAGAVAAFVQLGWLPREGLWMLASLWPLALIVIGVGLLFHARSPWIGGLLAVILVVLLLGGMLFGKSIGLRPVASWEAVSGGLHFGDSEGERLSGSGNRVQEERPVSGVTSVEVSIPAEVTIQTGAQESLTITADDNLLPFIQTEVRGDTLVIDARPGYNLSFGQPVTIMLTISSLRELQVSSSGHVYVKPLQTDELRLRLSSSGDVEIEAIQAGEIEARLSSSGNVRISGVASELDLDVSSSGEFIASDLQVASARANISSSGEVTLWVTEELEANLSSSGDLAYYGSPQVRQNVSSSGNLVPLGNK